MTNWSFIQFVIIVAIIDSLATSYRALKFRQRVCVFCICLLHVHCSCFDKLCNALWLKLSCSYCARLLLTSVLIDWRRRLWGG